MLPTATAPSISEPSPSLHDDRATHLAYTSSVPREHGFEPLRVEGRLPDGLRGTLYRNGPGLWDLFGRPYSHSFECDGAVAAVRLGGGSAPALGAHRVTQSEGLREERAAGRPLYGSNAAWRTRLWNGLRLRAKNTANTALLSWQGRLFALLEAARPTELDPATLDTIGPSDLGIEKLVAFTAHPRAVASHRTTYSYGVELGPRPKLDVHALPWTGPARRLTRIPLAHNVMIHDFAATERHLVFFVGPAELVIWRALFAAGDFRSLFEWRPEHGSEVIVVPIADPTRVVRFSVDAFWSWHVANAFERGGEIVVDLVRYDDFATMDQLGASGAPFEQGVPTRVVLDPARRTMRRDALTDARAEFPMIDLRIAGTSHRTMLLASDSGRRNALLRLDLERDRLSRFELEPGERASEMVFVPREKNAPIDDGWALSMVWSARTSTSHLAILDASRLEDGPVARVFFDHTVPLTFHGVFVPS
ncbi:carotenoid oxygenase family protein [Sandaracinus amylolyticus]|nr:carotenoid oxygenase family protein [Sandaracinus amylolyticus]